VGVRRRRGEVADEVGRVDADAGIDAEGDCGRCHPRHDLCPGGVSSRDLARGLEQDPVAYGTGADVPLDPRA
jgi:hypothetical protein